MAIPLLRNAPPLPPRAEPRPGETPAGDAPRLGSEHSGEAEAGTAPIGPGEQGNGVHATWTFTLGSIVFMMVVLNALLALVAVQAYAVSPSVVDALLMVTILASAALHVRYSWFLKAGRAGGLPSAGYAVVLVGTSALVWALGFFSPEVGMVAGIPLWIALCLMACLLPKRQRWTLVLIGLALVAVHLARATPLVGHPLGVTPIFDSWLLLTYSAAFPFMLLSSLWWWEIVVKLDQHRRIAAELAVAQERLRFAADLHDIQGHHLQVIALKSELAERMLTVDVAAAREHIHETRLIAKQALEETRSLVSDYREIALENELENAREVLSAAGATCELDLDALPGAMNVHRALAMTVREATTNILRHSDASLASIRLRTTGEGSTLTVSNNGLTPHARSNRTPGSGLAGLRDRVEAIGGRLETSIDAESDHFELRVWVPTSAGAAA